MDVICALVPRFLVALARRDNPALRDHPVVVGRSSETRGTVVACSDEAASMGVTPGMQLSRAQVLCPPAAVVPLLQEQVEAAERAFVSLVAEFCPAVEGIDPGHTHADVQGMARLSGETPQAHLASLQETFARRTGLPVRIGGASTVFAAHAAASYLADPVILLRAGDAGLLAELPVDALPVSQEMLRRLRLFGLERFEQLGALPPAALLAQFGREGLLAWRLIQGEETGRITPALNDVRVSERIELPAAAVASAPLVLATGILLQRALRRPEIDGRALRRADWVALLENNERLPLRSVFHEPTSDQARILFVLRNSIERQTLAAPAVAVELILSGICSEYSRQERLWQSGPRGNAALGATIEQLRARGGGPQIYHVVEVEPWSRIPERQRALAAYSP
jgi:nucleotidyltransferase/DNA polymerase involved in DNA repair